MANSESASAINIDLLAVVEYRQRQLRHEMAKRSIDAVLLTDAVNIRDNEGVKLEEQILVTETGIELLSDFPFEDALLA